MLPMVTNPRGSRWLGRPSSDPDLSRQGQLPVPEKLPRLSAVAAGAQVPDVQLVIFPRIFFFLKIRSQLAQAGLELAM